MTVNPPEPINFVDDENTKTVEHPNQVLLPDVQGVQLEVYRAGVEGRKPNFDDFPENAVAAAGWDKKKRKPLGVDPQEAYLETVTTEQTPIENSSGQVNEIVRPAMPNDPDQAEDFAKDLQEQEDEAAKGLEAAQNDAPEPADSEPAKPAPVKKTAPSRSNTKKSAPAKPLTRAQKAAEARKAAEAKDK